MDFSKYGPPSKQWLAFTAANPSAARDGFNDNDVSQAAALQEKINTARATLVAEHLARTGIADQVETSTLQIPTRDGGSIALRRTIPRGYTGRPLRAVLYFHGGGLLFGTETSDDDVCAEFAAALNVAVLGVIYRHTPEYKFPTQLDDAVDAFEYVVKHAAELHVDVEGMAILGNSAGALPATAVVQHDLVAARREGRRTLFAGVVLTVPWLIHGEAYPSGVFAPGKSSREESAEAPGLPAERVRLFRELLGGKADEPALSPGLWPDGELEGWPRTGIVVAGMDPLRDDGLYFAKRLEKLQ